MITPQTELTIEGSYMQNDFVWDNGLVFSPAAFATLFTPVLPDERFLQEPGYRSEREEAFASYRLIHEINEDWKLSHLFLFHRNEMNINAYRIGAVSTTGPGNITVNRRYDGTVPTATEINAIFDTTYKFELEETQHELLDGVDFSYEPEDGNTQDGLRGLPNPQPINAFNTAYGAVPSAFSTTTFFVERHFLGFYAQDQVSLLDDKLHLLLGGRFDYVDQDTLFIAPRLSAERPATTRRSPSEVARSMRRRRGCIHFSVTARDSCRLAVSPPVMSIPRPITSGRLD